MALKADTFLTEMEAGADDRLPKTAGDAQRLRLMVEGRTTWALSEDSHLTPVFEVGGRWDGGKAETDVGAEMGGGIAYAHTKLGLGIEARWWDLLAHQKSAFDEWGASLTLWPAQVEFDLGYGLVTHEGLGLLTIYGGLSLAGPDRRGVRLGGRIELGEWVDLSVEGEGTTQGGGADHQVALYGHLGW